jgi:hypothetical protein
MVKTNELVADTSEGMLADAKTRLTALRTENAELEQRLAAAVGDGDEQALLELRRRVDDLPVALALAEVRVIDLRIIGLQAQSAEATAKYRNFRPTIKTAEANVKAAEDRLRELRYQAQQAETGSNVSMDIGTLKRRRDELATLLAGRPGHAMRMR